MLQSNVEVLVYYKDDRKGESMETQVIDTGRRTLRPINAYIPLRIQYSSDGKIQWASLPYSSLVKFSGKILKQTLDFMKYEDRYGRSDVIDLGSKVVSVYKNWVDVRRGNV